MVKFFFTASAKVERSFALFASIAVAHNRIDLAAVASHAYVNSLVFVLFFEISLF